MLEPEPLFLAGHWRRTAETAPNLNPATGADLGPVCQADAAAADEALACATAAAPALAAAPTHERSALLRRISAAILEHAGTLAQTITRESGKPIRFAEGEIQRAAFTFDVAADEARRALGGEVLPLDAFPTGARRFAITRRFPIGPVLAISPFNFPLNLTAHKVAPALAAGCPVIVKPSPDTPLTNLALARLIAAAGAPEGALSVLPAGIPVAERLVRDARLGLLSFTGSAQVGWKLKQLAGRTPVLLELGNNAANLVHEDAVDTPVRLQRIAARLAFGAYAHAGQVCIKVQRILVHRPVFEPLLQAFVRASEAVAVGDPSDAATVVGPMIRLAEAERVIAWVDEARAQGAILRTGGRREGAYVRPTVLTDTTPEMKVNCEEVFGPVATVTPYEDFEQALALAADTRYGLQVGVFTRDVTRLWRAFERLEVGAVIANDISAFRVDHMPYGGVRLSGQGREGLAESIRAMTEPRLLVLNTGDEV